MRGQVGAISGGVAAAEWSPEGEVLALVSGDAQLLLMSKVTNPILRVPGPALLAHAPLVSRRARRRSTAARAGAGRGRARPRVARGSLAGAGRWRDLPAWHLWALHACPRLRAHAACVMRPAPADAAQQ